MNRTPWILALAVVVLGTVACSQDGGTGFTDNPVAPQTAEFTSLTGAIKSQTNICHWSPDWQTEGELYEYTVIGISTNGSAPSAHAAHGDPACDVSAFAVGDDCSACIAPAVPNAAQAAASRAGKSLICHQDVDDEELYDSIVISVNGNSVDTHLANHGDCYTVDPVGTENCLCAV